MKRITFLKLAVFMTSFFLIGLPPQKAQSDEPKTREDVIRSIEYGDLDFSGWNLEGVNLGNEGKGIFLGTAIASWLVVGVNTGSMLMPTIYSNNLISLSNLCLIGAFCFMGSYYTREALNAEKIDTLIKTGLPLANLTNATYNDKTIFPEGLKPKDKGMIQITQNPDRCKNSFLTARE